jgi:hypothetical protein
MGELTLTPFAQAQLPYPIDSLQIPKLLSDPPPILFLASCLSFAFAIAALRHSHRADRYQDRIISAGIVLGLAAALQADDFLMESKSYMAWSTILALLFSALIHRVLSLCSDSNTHENEKTRIAGEIG